MRYADWMRLAETEYARLLALLRRLDDDQWQAPTDCAEWTVHQLVAHLLGAAESTASPRVLVHQLRLGRRERAGGPLVDGINAVQVREREGRTPAQLLAELERAAGKGVRARRRLPAPVRAVRLPLGEPLGVRPLGYLMGCIYTRDAWQHRADISRAVAQPMELTADHDGLVVADIVSEWLAIHRQPCRLTLTGPAGGQWVQGERGEMLELDAVEFCRIVSGRAPGTGLLATPVPF